MAANAESVSVTFSILALRTLRCLNMARLAPLTGV